MHPLRGRGQRSRLAPYGAFIGAVCLGAASIANAAGVYKCAGPAGAPTYQGVPCAAGTELRDFASDPPPLSVISAPTQARAASDARRREVAAEPPARRALPASRATRREPVAGNPAERRHAHAGMSDAEILAKLGRPAITTRAARGKARWTYLPAAGDPETITILHLDRGTVVEVERRTVKP